MNKSDAKGISIKGQFYVSDMERGYTRIDGLIEHKERRSLEQLSKIVLENIDVFKMIESPDPEATTYETRLVVIKTEAYQETVKNSYDMMVVSGMLPEDAARVVSMFEELIGVHHG